jgi:D-alanyl-D-alanine carboxypeptidase
MFMKTKLLLCLTAICFPCFSQTFHQTADSIRRVYNIPALGYSIIKSDSILDTDVFGYNRTDRNEKASLNSRFHIGSNSKAITALLAAKLVEQNKVNWDTRFLDLFPALRRKARRAYQDITLQELLSHRARLKPFTAGDEFFAIADIKDYERQKLKFASFVLRQRPQMLMANESYKYSNAGYTLGLMMLEKVTGKTYRDLINDLLNAPLGLDILIGWPNSNDTTQPCGHQGKLFGYDTLRPQFDTNEYRINCLITPAGDLNMKLPDYAKLMQLFLKGLRGQDVFLKSETYKHLLFGMPDYSLGWANGVKNKQYYAFHDGSGGTFFCHILIVKELDLGIAIVSNSAEEATKTGIFALRDLILKKYSN